VEESVKIKENPASMANGCAKTPFWEKLALGVGQVPIFLGNTCAQSFAVPVFQMTLGLNLNIMAIAMFIPRLWDAFSDPVMGRISDNCRSRFGRRKPFIFVGAILMGLSFGAMWMVPEELKGNEMGLMAYMIGGMSLFYICYTIYSVPFNSLTYEMTPDYDERTKIGAYLGFFGKAGEFLYNWIFPLTGLAIFGSVMVGVRWVGWGVGLFLLLGLGLIPAIFVKERYQKVASRQNKVAIISSLKESLANRAFLVLLGISLCQVLAGMFTSQIDYYLLVYYMSDGDVALGSVKKGLLSSGFSIVGIVGIPFVVWLAGKYSKEGAMIFVYVLAIVGGVLKWWIFTPGQWFPFVNDWVNAIPILGNWIPDTKGVEFKILLDPLFSGIIWIALAMLTPAMLADVCDDDELRHGSRREGMFGAIYSFVTNLGFSIALSLSFVALSLSGLDGKLAGAQSLETFQTMRIILSAAPVVFAVIGIWLLCRYPLTKKRNAEIRRELEKRRGEVT
jgi:GPH family glycoside/pentoside/hexuronide:cation symporter